MSDNLADTNVVTHVNGTELSFNAEDVATCLERLGDGPVENDIAISGNVVIVGDAFYDTDVYVSHVEDFESYIDGSFKSERRWITSTSALREAIDELRRESFEEYVRDIDGLLSINEYETTDNGNVEVTSWCFDGSELTALHEDDGTNVVSVDEDDGDVTILVRDVRDE